MSTTTEMMNQNIGFIGLGAMGYAMAMNVRHKMPKNATLFINDAFEENCVRFKDEYEAKLGRVEIVQSAKAIAERALTVISIVPTARHVKDVYLNPETGIIAARDTLSPNAPSRDERVYLECSTIDVETAREIGLALKTAGMGTYVDAPVSGGVPGADRGDLSFLLGATQGKAEDNAQDRIKTTALYMGSQSKLFYCGGLGFGLAAKICNNYLSCTILLATAEAMATGIKLGIDKHLLHQVIQNSTGQSFMADHVCPVPGVVPDAPSSHGYRLGFKAQMLQKDVGLGVDAANSVGIKPSIGAAAMEVYRKVALDERCIDKDASVVYRFLGGPE